MFEILGLVLSFIGLATLIPQLYGILAAHLPEQKLKQLDDALKETTELLDAAMLDGFIRDHKFETSLHRIRCVTETLRARVVCAPGFYKQCLAFAKGLSGRIGHVYKDVTVVRARIVTISEEARQLLLREDLTLEGFAEGERRNVTNPHHLPSSDRTLDISQFKNRESPNVSMTSHPVAPQVAMPSPTHSDRKACTLYNPLRYTSISSAHPAYADALVYEPTPLTFPSTMRRSSRISASIFDRASPLSPLPFYSPPITSTVVAHERTTSHTSLQVAPSLICDPVEKSSGSDYHHVLQLVQSQGQVTHKLAADMDHLMELVGMLLARVPSTDLEAGKQQLLESHH
ncbi:hypothetical protein BXZ70DRAFT_926323 [Cristinia sonorae]|uniref:Uncharacterized protein n=1 Tax=Cristinia sonorae TaxID=1940300 RepID=A0A8K0UUR9_9AGAR|nr:hypothetical protein BXZ70DRAFT_926323 [Cristinia sonorae]